MNDAQVPGISDITDSNFQMQLLPRSLSQNSAETLYRSDAPFPKEQFSCVLPERVCWTGVWVRDTDPRSPTKQEMLHHSPATGSNLFSIEGTKQELK